MTVFCRVVATFVLVVSVYPTLFAQDNSLPLVWERETQKLFPQALLCDRMGRDVLYAAMKNGGLMVFDLSQSKSMPAVIATLGVEKFAGLDVMHVTQQRDRLYLALGDFFNIKGAHAGLAVVDVGKPENPQVLSLWKSPKTLQGAAAVIVKDKYAYLGAMQHGVFVFDIGDPKKISKASEILPDVDFPLKNPGKIQHPNARGFAIGDHLLYLAFDAGGLRVINIENPLQPHEVGRYINFGMGKKQQAYNNLVLDGDTAYVAVDYAGLEILDIRDPTQIKQLSWWNPWDAQSLKNLWFNSDGHTNQIEFDAKRRLLYLSAGDSELLVVDVVEPLRPKLTARYGESNDKRGAWGVTISKDRVYLAYINAVVPFRGNWSGIKVLQR